MRKIALCVVVLAGPVGCGTNLNEVLYQSGAAAGRTVLDLWLTDLADSLADSLDRGATPPSEDDEGGDSGDQDGGGDGSTDGPVLDDLTGDPAVGETLYAANNCAACHCPDASGGCALNAPSPARVSAEALDGFLRGDMPHPSKVGLTEQEIVDLQVYLAGF